MIIKKILVGTIEEADKTVNQIFGPDAIILLSRVLSPNKTELTVGYEKDEEPCAGEEEAFRRLLYEDEDDHEDAFWLAETLPEISLLAEDVECMR